MAKISFMLQPNQSKHVRIAQGPNSFVQVEFKTLDQPKIFQVDSTLMFKVSDSIQELDTASTLHLFEDFQLTDCIIRPRLGIKSV